MPRIAPLARMLLASTSKPSTPILPALRSLRISSSSPSSSSFASSSRSILSSTSLSGASRPSLTSASSSILSLISQPQTMFQRQPGQIRTLAYGAMYQPSQRKRKRKHGFLSRSKGGRLGQKTLARRAARGRRFLSH